MHLAVSRPTRGCAPAGAAGSEKLDAGLRTGLSIQPDRIDAPTNEFRVRPTFMEAYGNLSVNAATADARAQNKPAPEPLLPIAIAVPIRLGFGAAEAASFCRVGNSKPQTPATVVAPKEMPVATWLVEKFPCPLI